jgi:hypothetical protein
MNFFRNIYLTFFDTGCVLNYIVYMLGKMCWNISREVNTKILVLWYWRKIVNIVLYHVYWFNDWIIEEVLTCLSVFYDLSSMFFLITAWRQQFLGIGRMLRISNRLKVSLMSYNTSTSIFIRRRIVWFIRYPDDHTWYGRRNRRKSLLET